jgi:CRISPR type IV-associated protein Csf1
MITPSNLFSNYNYISGNFNCYYCGTQCSKANHVKNYVKKTFTNRDIVKYPNSNYVCGGCVESFSEKTVIELCTGEKRTGQRVRSYSWIIEKKKKIAYTKAHIDKLRERILNPPDPPFCIILADSGQKHLIFRAKINLVREKFYVSLEEDIICVNPIKLQKYIDIVMPIISVCGKIVIKNFEENKINITINLFKNFGDYSEEIINNFLSVDDKQLLRLAIWLSPNKEACSEFFKSTRIQRKNVRTKSNGNKGQISKRVHKNGGYKTLFDIS